MLTYNTKQKNRLIQVIKKYDKEFTVRDIYENTKHEIGLTTIYRLIDRLVSDGILSKAIGNNNTTYYQYLEKCSKENHFYLKCQKCGNILHIDCDCIGQLRRHILYNHKFIINKEHIIINGICNKCNSRGDNIC